jgi:hypothetical protein
MHVDPKEFEKIPYLRAEVVGTRVVGLAPLWDGRAWHLWVPAADGGLAVMNVSDYAEGSYFSRSPARPDDVHFPFVEFVWKRASWPDVCHWVGAIENDVHQLAASLAKIDFLWTKREEVSGGVFGLRRFIAGEVEHVVTVCRSTLDELQAFIRAVWEHVRLVDAAEQSRKGSLRKSFADMVIADGQLLSVEDIGEKRNVPLPLSATYAQAGMFLQTLRDLRDDIVHRGKEPPFVFTTEHGFALEKNAKHFVALGISKGEHAYNENLVSLRPALAYLVMTTLYTCNSFAEVLSGMIEFPPDLAPDHHVFIRTVHGPSLIRTQETLRNGSPWWD